MNDNLTLKDVKAIAESRYNIGWFKRQTISVIGFILAIILIITGTVVGIALDVYKDNENGISYHDNSGKQIVVDTFDEGLIIDGVYYTKDTDKDNENHSNIGLIILIIGIVVTFIVIIYEYANEGRFKEKFVQHWVDKKEFLDVNK
jgi:uncharacterized membrane protein